jgi:hypothetical protein
MGKADSADNLTVRYGGVTAVEKPRFTKKYSMSLEHDIINGGDALNVATLKGLCVDIGGDIDAF